MRVSVPGVADPGPKGFLSGTHRLVDPGSTLDRARPLMRRMGITRVANVTGLDTIGIPVVMVVRPNSCGLAVSQGKGLTLAHAKASGLMESIECFHAEHVLAPLTLASYDQLQGERAVVDVAGLPHVTPAPFDAGRRVLWIEGHELMSDRPIQLPLEAVHTNYSLPLPQGSGALAITSNGLASGNHLLEAISHGICEVVERDATTLFYCRDEGARRRLRVDLATVDDPACRDALDRYDAADVDVAVWEVTSDVGIPAFLCFILDRYPSPLRPLPGAEGMGCHPTRRIALLRALLEAAQSRLTAISGSRDDFRRDEYDRFMDLDHLRHLQEEIGAHPGLRPFSAAPNFEGASFSDDVEWELGQLRAVGLTQVAVVDLTRRDFGLPVIRAVIPGLEGPTGVVGLRLGARALATDRGQA